MDKTYLQKNPSLYSALVGWVLGVLLVLWSYLTDNVHSSGLSVAMTVLYFALFVLASVWVFRR